VIVPPRKVAHLLLAVAGAGVVLFSTAAVARIMDWFPTPAAASDDISSGDGPSAMTAFELPPAAAGRNHGMWKCAECGAVVSIRKPDNRRAAKREPAQPNAETAARAADYYEITIRLRDGSNRVITDVNPAAWRVGERVGVIDGKTVAIR
jgi:hypothetical protein